MKKKLLYTVFVLSVLANLILVPYVGFRLYKDRLNNDIFRLNAYAWANSQLKAPQFDENRVVFIGNSITENWVHLRYRFFVDNNYVCRGKGGQTSSLLLLRFRQDVIDLHPKAVVINAGINDIGEKTGVYDPVFAMNNIKSMAELAELNGIKVIISSVLPCKGHGWEPIKEVPEKIDDLNERIKAYATERGYYYLDYNTPMRDSENGMNAAYSLDGLHPNEAGYKEIMEPLVQNAINEVLKQTDKTE
ncbi:capsular biosynthesis protein [Dysgonomonas sp. 521]|uniref:GDSL-type esterase/lipase family protein n=1 Tax=Dysgonomonas sp. 521 TaxID=2302932 RepID=UPI0013D4290B|nr:GDSL-type esterase/lipase family protein [Dysgonomonas sp. 521]NDV96704.1 capsular biosynthesis protein [Dysgonomonas sp. 521]